MPMAIEEHNPSVRTRKLPSPGLRAFHSSVVAPAELTTSASPITVAKVFKQSNRFTSFFASSFLASFQRNPFQSAPTDVLRPNTSFVNNSATGRLDSSVKTWALLMTSLT